MKMTTEDLYYTIMEVIVNEKATRIIMAYRVCRELLYGGYMESICRFTEVSLLRDDEYKPGESTSLVVISEVKNLSIKNLNEYGHL
jgi:hypothetical protein